MIPPRRKKWTEVEESTLIKKYGEMVSDGTLLKMKTREKKFKPIALYVNSVHHVRDPSTYPWQWTWKDVSTKVQNMRHQYLLVKQKIWKPELLGMENSGGGLGANVDEFDWVEGLTHWSNFLRYKKVFGDVPIACSSLGGNGCELMGFLNEEREIQDGQFGGDREMEMMTFGQVGNADVDFANVGGGDDGVLGGMGFNYEGDAAEENCNGIEGTREDGVCSLKFEEAEPSASNSRRKKCLKGLKRSVQFRVKSVDGVLGGMGFNYEGDAAEENCNGIEGTREDGVCSLKFEEAEPSASNSRRKKGLKGLKRRVFSFVSNQLGQLKEAEARFEQWDVERERERQKGENDQMARQQEWQKLLEEMEKTKEENEKAREKLRENQNSEWKNMQKEIEEREKRRAEDELHEEREWHERMSRRRTEWRKGVDEMLHQHQTEMSQVQTRILHEQQNLTNQFLGIFSHWTGHRTSLSDHSSTSNHYFSQMMQNLHHVNDMVHEDAQVDGDTQDDQFIVDG